MNVELYMQNFLPILFGCFLEITIEHFPIISRRVYKSFFHSLPINIATIIISIILSILVILRESYWMILIVLFIASFIITLETIGICRMWKIKDKLLVIIARFDDFSKQIGVDIDGRIYEKLLNDKNSDPNISSLIIKKSLFVVKNEEEAKKEGNSDMCRNAKIIIVIWGKSEDIGVTTYFSIIKAPEKSLITKIPVSKEINTMDELRNFNFSYYKETLPSVINALSYFTFGLSFYLNNNYDEALRYFNESCNRLPKCEKLDMYYNNIHFYIGNSYYVKGDPTQAEKEYREAIKINSDDAEALNNLGNILFQFKRYEDAEKEWKKVISINPNIAEAYNNLGILFKHLKHYDEAEKAFREAIMLKPNLVEAHYNLGVLLAELKRYGEAEKEHKKAIKINKNCSDAYNGLGNLYKDLKRYKDSERYYRKAIKIAPDIGEFNYNLSLLLAENLGHFKEAERVLVRTLKVNPNNSAVHNGLGNLSRKFERLEEAEKEYREAIKLEPTNAGYHYNLARLLADLSRIEEAEQEYREAIGLNPNFAEAYRNLGVLLKVQGNIAEAREKVLKAKELFKKQQQSNEIKICDDFLAKFA